MLSLNFIRENGEAVAKAIADKNVNVDLGALLAIDVDVRSMKSQVDELRRRRTEISDGFKRADHAERPAIGQKAKELGAEISGQAGAAGEQAGGVWGRERGGQF